MSKQANPKLIGAFVLGGAALLLMFVVIIAGGSLFQERDRVVTYFDGSVKGLTVGSNVAFRGVPLGTVSKIEIDLLSKADDITFSVPVYLDLNKGVVNLIGDGNSRFSDITPEEKWKLLIEKGLRAQLSIESLITGQLYVEMDFFPDQPAVFRGNRGDYFEVPSTPSGIEMVLNDLRETYSDITKRVDIPKMAEEIASAIKGIDELANSEDLRASLAGANNLINDASTQNLTKQLDATLVSLRQAIERVDSILAGTEDDIGLAIESLTETLAEAEKFLTVAEQNLKDDSNLAIRVSRALKELEGAARALRVLAEQIEQQPESIIKGQQ